MILTEKMSIIIIFIGLMLVPSACIKSSESTRSMEAIVKKIEIGLDRSTVESVFSSEGVEFSYIKKENKIYAIFRYKSGFIKEAQQLVIIFDEKNQVQIIEKKTVYTGP